MTKTEELKVVMLRKGISSRALASKLKISENSFSRKLNNDNEFKASEIRLLSEALKLTDSETSYIFLQTV